MDKKNPDLSNKEFKQWLKLAYKRKLNEEKAGFYEYNGEFLTERRNV
jgi:hypothetical protein